jgi:hypothetical protein
VPAVIVGVEARVFDEPEVLFRVIIVAAVVDATEIESEVAVIVFTL